MKTLQIKLDPLTEEILTDTNPTALGLRVTTKKLQDGYSLAGGLIFAFAVYVQAVVLLDDPVPKTSATSV